MPKSVHVGKPEVAMVRLTIDTAEDQRRTRVIVIYVDVECDVRFISVDVQVCVFATTIPDCESMMGFEFTTSLGKQSCRQWLNNCILEHKDQRFQTNLIQNDA